MAVTIIEDVPGGHGWSSLGRFLAVCIGVALLVTGALAAVLPLGALVLYGSNIVEGVENTPPSATGLGQLLLLAAVAVVFPVVGLRVIRGRRLLGLYLRKFGFGDTTRTVSFALKSAAGRSLRLVTLDDAMVVPIGAGAGKRRVAAGVWILMGGLAAIVIFYLCGGGYDADAQRNLDEAINSADSTAERFLAGPMIAIINALAFAVAVFFVCLVVVIMAVALGAHRAARRAERAASRALTSQHEVGGAARQLAAAARKTFAPRLMVVAVPTAFWQQAIRGLAGVCDIVVIDVSNPTDALLWEVRNIKPMFAGRWILVGARDRVAVLADERVALTGTPQGLLAKMLDGERILAYGPGPDDVRHFAGALRRAIAEVGRR
ncbi:hypothetical protein Cme02nite_49210 [Catellatospora methionotrophica]|uniref:Uncharacterized protein n=1 Tax=Catellatospora methionotrophica TaxID=121620 RepID=A0A8J3LDJ1_9ACTN|nr:hypothetical protein [Catellatospora methionotrophica]GIG16589.1 hypothetical protein Cme02nite_49210 [Catellatospora methionotrophica]